MLVLLLACAEKSIDLGVDTPCPLLDCRDEAVLRLEDVDGVPLADFWGSVVTAEGTERRFDCTTDPPQGDDGVWCETGAVHAYTDSPTLELQVWVGEVRVYLGVLNLTYSDPYATDECGPYCDVAEATVVVAS